MQRRVIPLFIMMAFGVGCGAAPEDRERVPDRTEAAAPIDDHDPPADERGDGVEEEEAAGLD